jgi:hypothetical protein
MAMSVNPLLASIAAAVTVTSGAIAYEPASPGLEQQVNIPEMQARERALMRVVQGSVRTSRLEMRDGKPVWYFDIVGYDERSRADVIVDATTGEVTSNAGDLSGPTDPEPAGTYRSPGAEVLDRPGGGLRSALLECYSPAPTPARRSFLVGRGSTRPISSTT